MQEGYEKNKVNFEKYGLLVSLQYPEYNGKPNFTKFLDHLGGDILSGNWQGAIDYDQYPKAFDMKLEYENNLLLIGLKFHTKGTLFIYCRYSKL